MATVTRFENLIMFQKARELTKGVYSSLRSCSDGGYKDQIQRASVSVLSNIAEGFESGSKEMFLHYLFIAKASAGEVRAQLYVGYDIGYLKDETFKDLKNQAEECSKLVSSFIGKVKKNDVRGLRSKREKKDDPLDEMLKKAGKIKLKDGKVVSKTKQ